jgi:hypothetical protein
MSNKKGFPRYFCHPPSFNCNSAYWRFDGAHSCVVVRSDDTESAEPTENLDNCLFQVQRNWRIEITKEEIERQKNIGRKLKERHART